MLNVYYLKRLGAFELSDWYLLGTFPDIASLMQWIQSDDLKRLDAIGFDGTIYQCENGIYYKVLEEL